MVVKMVVRMLCIWHTPLKYKATQILYKIKINTEIKYNKKNMLD